MTRKQILESMVPEIRTDARHSAFLEQELEAIEAEIYRVEISALKWRKFLPVDHSYPAGVETISYRVYDMFGMAKFIHHYANDLPNVGVRGEKFSSTVEGIGVSYGYSTQDLRAAAMAGFPLDRENAMAAMEAMEMRMDHAAALGKPALGMVGFVNHPNVPIDTAADIGAGVTEWSAKTADQILNDMNAFVQAQWEDTQELHPPDTLLLPTAQYGLISTKRVGVDTSTTVLQMFLANSPFIKTVDSWYRLNTADEAGTGPRAVAYKKDPRVVKVAVPMEAIQHEPERRSLMFSVPVEARFGGTLVRMPLAIRYLDGI
jgi:hypothetical protein